MKLDYACRHCDTEMFGSFGDNVECPTCHAVYETDWDYTDGGDIACWLTEEIKQPKQ